jgi:predicted lipid-binding transport protein (Tim44 family)
MKHALIALFAVVLGAGLIMDDAEAARRLGGGASSGMQRSQPMKRDATPNQNAAPTSAPQKSGASRWLGPLAGLAAGIGLASLFSHFGMGEGFASIVMLMLIAAAVFFVFRLLMRRAQPATRRVQYAGGPVSTAAYEAPAAGGSAASPTRSGPSRVDGPASFDAESFVRHAKVNFLRLQAANDEGNLEDIRAFTTPEMFAEIRLRMQERGTAPQKTDVVKLDAELLEVATEFREHIASVRFFGTIRETAGAAPEAFDEIWHLTKPIDDSRNWAIAGIQQSS